MGRYFLRRQVFRALLALLVMVPAVSWAEVGGGSNEERWERMALATGLLKHRGVSLLDFHISRVEDEATAKDNLRQAARGRHAKRSYYGNGPGGAVELDVRMLRALMVLANEGYTFRITEFAGGSHSCNSRHYCGVGFDIDTLDGRKIGHGHPGYREFMARCKELGATEVLGPGSRGHSTHLHVAWPRE